MKRRGSVGTKKGGINLIIGMPYIWLAAVVILLAFEAFTTALTTIWFAGGALVAAIAAILGVGFVGQLFWFVFVSLILVILMRPIALKYMNKGVTKTNVNSFVGKKAVVTKEVNNLIESGQVKIGDIEWKARSKKEDDIFPVGTVVVIEDVDGVKLIVSKVEKEN